MEDKKIKWMRPTLDKFAADEKTAGQCENGSGDVIACGAGSSGDAFLVCSVGNFVV